MKLILTLCFFTIMSVWLAWQLTPGDNAVSLTSPSVTPETVSAATPEANSK